MNAPSAQSLEEALVSRIRSDGPIGVDDYMAACLGTTGSGYYQSRDPFGSAGDFITAPEVSGLFGEMCGLYLAHMFELSSMPSDATVIELGPGRGTLLRDMRHVWDQLMPPLASAPVRLLETSPTLRDEQADCLAGVADIAWHDDISPLLEDAAGPVFGIANEFFDALPVAQLVWQSGSWHRRLVGIEDGRLGFTTAEPCKAHDPALPPDPHDGMVAELCPLAETVMQHLASAVARPMPVAPPVITATLPAKRPFRGLELVLMISLQKQVQMHSPPSTTSACPVMKVDMLDAKNRIELAISSVLPQRAIGIVCET